VRVSAANGLLISTAVAHVLSSPSPSGRALKAAFARSLLTKTGCHESSAEDSMLTADGC